MNDVKENAFLPNGCHHVKDALILSIVYFLLLRKI